MSPCKAILVFLPVFGLAAGILAQEETASPDAGSDLSGMVFEDKNENGLKDPDELGGGGVIVDLLDFEGKFIARVVTDANGKYSFQGLEEGTYFLRFEFSVGFGVRSRGIEVAGGETVFSPIPIITPDSNYSFLRLNLMNPAHFRGEEVSPFQP